ncbi:MAG: hypothetical protein M3128_10965 [Verrucomicrobiota bacterium]|nr:hypothetical protein [Verrucomicrobiota bacterium]
MKDPLVSEILEKRWFLPIAQRIETFEEEFNIFPEVGSITSPEAPDWIVNCVWNQMRTFNEVSGLEKLDRIRARNIGAMIGAKNSVLKRLAGGNLWFNQLPTKQQKRFEELFGTEAVEEAKEIWSRCAREIYPQFKRVRRFATELVMSQELIEQVQFHQGIANGLTFSHRVTEAVHRHAKQQTDQSRRFVVCFFILQHWEMIEAARKDILWSDLMDQFDQEYGEFVHIDEEAFKKILQRSGLTVGRVGRPKTK